MELKEYFKNVGSNPCLVLNFDASATMGTNHIVIDSNLGLSKTLEEAQIYRAQFTKMIESECDSRCVLFKIRIVETDYEALKDVVSLLNNFIFFDDGSNGLRVLFIASLFPVPSLGLKPSNTTLIISAEDNGYQLKLRTTIDIT